MEKAYYVRNLPHWHPPGEALFVTWRLYGSLPKALLQALRGHKDPDAGRAFARMDQALDKADTGPRWLAEADIARLVADTLQLGQRDWKWFELSAYVIMSNHVHVLFRPFMSPGRIMQRVKGTTAKAANELLGRTGQTFWQDESYDHWVRNGGEFERIKAYVERNPVKAGLAKTPEDWPWSSAALRNSSSAGSAEGTSVVEVNGDTD